MLTHLETDILEHEVKWALESIMMKKPNGGDRILAGLFQILKDDALKGCTQYVSKFGKLSRGHRTGKGPFHSNPKERQCQTMFKYRTIVLISHGSKVMLKIRQARLQQYMNREPDIKWPASTGSQKKQESSSKTSTSASLTMPKPLTVGITKNCGKFLKIWEYWITLPAS